MGHWTRRVDFRLLAEALGRCRMRWGEQMKSQNRKNVYLSPYVEEPLNSKVIKSFVPEQRSRKCFSCSRFLCDIYINIYVYMLCTFNVRFVYPYHGYGTTLWHPIWKGVTLCNYKATQLFLDTKIYLLSVTLTKPSGIDWKRNFLSIEMQNVSPMAGVTITTGFISFHLIKPHPQRAACHSTIFAFNPTWTGNCSMPNHQLLTYSLCVLVSPYIYSANYSFNQSDNNL